MTFLLSFVLSVLFIFNNDIVAFGQGQAPVVAIADGQLRGATNKTVYLNVTYYSYRGIPFAKKPVGDLRFAAPVKNDPWTGILNATADRDFCVQTLDGYGNRSSTGLVQGSEDCLYINVYTTNVNGSLPVMVWIYGGGFSTGSSAYDSFAPDYFLEKNVTYVAFNYRVGVFGFLSTEDLASPGNWGLKDQVLALKWVKENIKHFGGDPNKVTIFGESAGSASVSHLIQSPKTQGLFGGAIMQSGSSLSAWNLTPNPRSNAFKVGRKLGIFTLSTTKLIERLRKVDYRTLKLAENNVTVEEYLVSNLLAGLPFGVVKEPDHPEALFSTSSWKTLLDGNFQRVPIIAGYNSLESGIVGTYIDYIKPMIYKYEINRSLLTPNGMTRNPLSRFLAGNDIYKYYFNTGPIANKTEALSWFLSYDLFERPIREEVNLTSKYTQVYFYQFSYKGLLGDPLQVSPKVSHAEELQYLFVSHNRTVNERDRAMINKFVTLWTNFAKTGNPTPQIESQNGSQNGAVLGGATWLPNEPNQNAGATVQYLNISDTFTMLTNPYQDEWIFYQKLYAKYGTPPYTTY